MDEITNASYTYSQPYSWISRFSLSSDWVIRQTDSRLYVDLDPVLHGAGEMGTKFIVLNT